MASVPQGAFAAKKVRKNLEKSQNQYYCDAKPEASHYNSKYMDSIWGMYNRFSVHNLKKIMDSNKQQQYQKPTVDLRGIANSAQLSISVERLTYLPL